MDPQSRGKLLPQSGIAREQPATAHLPSSQSEEGSVERNSALVPRGILWDHRISPKPSLTFQWLGRAHFSTFRYSRCEPTTRLEFLREATAGSSLATESFPCRSYCGVQRFCPPPAFTRRCCKNPRRVPNRPVPGGDRQRRTCLSPGAATPPAVSARWCCGPGHTPNRPRLSPPSC